jgi:hypothetical protein
MEKLELIKNGLPLRTFIFTIQTGPVHIQVPEDCKPVLAYDEAEAFDKIKVLYAGRSVAYRSHGGVTVQGMLDKISLPTAPAPTVNFVIDKTKEQFVNELMLVVDKYVDNARDQASLKRILTKIKNYGEPKIAGITAGGQVSVTNITGIEGINKA